MKKRILIIEDEEDVLKTTRYALEREGFEISEATNGKQGLEKAIGEIPDLVILDLRLPKLPGEEVCRQIRKNAKTAATPVIMVTAKDTDVDKVIGKVIGADYYITKPFEIDDLIGKINAIFKKKPHKTE